MTGVRDHLFDQLPHVGVVDDVEDPGTVPTSTDQPGQSQFGQVLRDPGRLRPDQLGQFTDRVLAVQQRPNDAETSVIPEQLQHADGGGKLLPRGYGLYGLPGLYSLYASICVVTYIVYQ